MGDHQPDQDLDSAAMLDAFQHQPRDVDADTRAHMTASADASTAAADALLSARTARPS